MNEGVLIRYLGKWMAFRRSLGLGFRGGLRWGKFGCFEALELIFQIGFGCGIFGFLVDFGWFWEAKMVPKIDFW